MIRYTIILAILLPLATALGRGEGPCASDADCDAPLSCVGRSTNLKCFMKKPQGMRCGKDPFWVCQEGLVCEDEICKIDVAGECTGLDDSACADGLSCVGGTGTKKCFKPKPRGMPCGVDPFWVCEKGLICIDRVCTKTVGKGKRCGMRRSCKSRFVCAGPSRGKRCVLPGKLGTKCGMYDTCRDSTCADGTCVA